MRDGRMAVFFIGLNGVFKHTNLGSNTLLCLKREILDMKIYWERLIEQFSYLAKSLTDKTGYIAFFKGGVFLLTACAIAIQQVSTVALPIELSAYELKYQVEHSLGNEFDTFSDLKCDVAHESYTDCQMAKYKRELSSSTLDALYSWLEVLFFLSYVMISLSIIGFLFHPQIHKDRGDVREKIQNEEGST